MIYIMLCRMATHWGVRLDTGRYGGEFNGIFETEQRYRTRAVVPSMALCMTGLNKWRMCVCLAVRSEVYGGHPNLCLNLCLKRLTSAVSGSSDANYCRHNATMKDRTRANGSSNGSSGNICFVLNLKKPVLSTPHKR